MKVLFVSSGNSDYSISPFIKSQGESLKKEGINLDYYTIKGKGIKGYLKNIIPLRKLIKENNYDIIHAHYGLIGMVCLLTFTRVPIVLSIMGSDAYGSFNQQGKRIKSSYIDMIITQLTLPFVKWIIVKSNNLFDYVTYEKKCSIIPNGVNFQVFKPDDKNIVKNKILWLANPKDPRKNFQLLKKAYDLLNNNAIDLINPFPIKHEEFAKYLNNSSVFVLTSFNEGSPNVIKEAMACNIPIVSTDVGDVKEVIGNTEGCFITTFDPKNVAEMIQKALNFGKRTAGRIDINHLESSVIAGKIIDVYKRCLNK